MGKSKPHLCFVAPAIWPVFSGDTTIQAVGGAEVQQSILARAFAAAGHPVTIVTMDYGQSDGIEIDGVRVFKAHTPDGGLPVLRFLHPRLTSLWDAMRRADADIYYQRSCGMLAGVTARFCRSYGRKMIYAAAHDRDFDPGLPLIQYARDRWLFRYGVRHADAIVVQNFEQQAACKMNFQRESTLVKSCYAVAGQPVPDMNGYILWVATLRSWKRPELFMELAKRFPQYRFRMVGGAAGGAEGQRYFQGLQAQASQIPNLEFVGFVPYAEIDVHFNGARLFINTSEAEGFPNTFLQAWGRGIPTLSFLKSKTTQKPHGMDWAVSDVAAMAEAIAQLSEDREMAQSRGEAGRQYYRAEHSPDAVLQKYQTVISSLTNPESVVATRYV